jgi:hypothetical protein
MALYNNKYNFIFFHLFKCGGNSIRRVLDEHTTGGDELLGVHSLPRDVEKHYRARSRGDNFEQKFKFTFVRNPFDFLLSTYYYAVKFANHYMHDDCVSMDFNDFPEYYMKVREKQNNPIIHGANRVCTLYEWITNDEGKVIVDYIGKLENINEDSKEILTKIGLPELPIPVVNVNHLNNLDYREVYNDKGRSFVEEHFAKDLEYFDYKF